MRPDIDMWLAALVRATADRSTCTRRQVGALIVDGRGQIISSGYNGAPAGMPHCVAPEPDACTRSIHAEANAIYFAARRGISTDGMTMVCSLQPCVKCAQGIIQAGIVQVVYLDEYDAAGSILLIEAGVYVRRYARH